MVRLRAANSLDSMQGFRHQLQGFPRHARQDLSGEIIGRGAEAAGGDHHICPLPGLVKCLHAIFN